jgi:hypothetical protein
MRLHWTFSSLEDAKNAFYNEHGQQRCEEYFKRRL